MAVYPKKIPETVLLSSFADRLPGTLIMTGQPKIRSSFALGFLPDQAKYGVHPIALCGNRFFRYMEWVNAHDQYSGPKPAEFRMHRIMLPNVRFGRSARPFWKEAWAAVGSKINLHSFTMS